MGLGMCSLLLQLDETKALCSYAMDLERGNGPERSMAMVLELGNQVAHVVAMTTRSMDIKGQYDSAITLHPNSCCRHQSRAGQHCIKRNRHSIMIDALITEAVEILDTLCSKSEPTDRTMLYS